MLYNSNAFDINLSEEMIENSLPNLSDTKSVTFNPAITELFLNLATASVLKYASLDIFLNCLSVYANSTNEFEGVVSQDVAAESSVALFADSAMLIYSINL